jgi:hypothetical protein
MLFVRAVILLLRSSCPEGPNYFHKFPTSCSCHMSLRGSLTPRFQPVNHDSRAVWELTLVSSPSVRSSKVLLEFFDGALSSAQVKLLRMVGLHGCVDGDLEWVWVVVLQHFFGRSAASIFG